MAFGCLLTLQQNLKYMKIEQLRIGNYLSYYGGTCIGYLIGIVSSFTKSEKLIMSIEGGGWCPHQIEDVTPIPLTEEWLKRLGFKNSEEAPDYFYHQEFERIYVRFVSYNFIYGNKLGDIVPVDGVHKLQNIFFALTDTELTAKNTEQATEAKPLL